MVLSVNISFPVCTQMIVFFFFFSSRRRHTRGALVTGVHTCALPIYRGDRGRGAKFEREVTVGHAVDAVRHRTVEAERGGGRIAVEREAGARERRSAERRVGKECGSTCRSRWSTDH